LHVGKQLSFVYDIADLYKVEVTIPAAFRAAAAGGSAIESRVRRECRELFVASRLMERIVPDMQRVVGLNPQKAALFVHRGEEEGEAMEEGKDDPPGALWNPDGSRSAGGKNFGPVKARVRSGPSVAKAEPEHPFERGDAFEDDLEWPAEASGDDGVPF
jgi:CRISP-associated protein Cas1